MKGVFCMAILSLFWGANGYTQPKTRIFLVEVKAPDPGTQEQVKRLLTEELTKLKRVAFVDERENRDYELSAVAKVGRVSHSSSSGSTSTSSASRDGGKSADSSTASGGSHQEASTLALSLKLVDRNGAVAALVKRGPAEGATRTAVASAVKELTSLMKWE